MKNALTVYSAHRSLQSYLAELTDIQKSSHLEVCSPEKFKSKLLLQTTRNETHNFNGVQLVAGSERQSKVNNIIRRIISIAFSLLPVAKRRRIVSTSAS